MPQVDFQDFVDSVRSGEYLVSFPTDTVPALAAKPESAYLIYEAKERSFEKPLILMAGSEADLWPYLLGSEAERRIWQQVMQQHWPGALTLVLPASEKVPVAMNPKDPSTIGVRVPNHPLAQTILRSTGPLATTSANKSGEPAILDLDEIGLQFPEVRLLSDAALTGLGVDRAQLQASGTPSTVVQWVGDGWKVLRQGSIVLTKTAEL